MYHNSQKNNEAGNAKFKFDLISNLNDPILTKCKLDLSGHKSLENPNGQSERKFHNTSFFPQKGRIKRETFFVLKIPPNS